MIVIMGMMVVIMLAIVGDGAIRQTNPTIGKMRVIVVVAIDGKRFRGARAEETEVFRACQHLCRRTATADMAIEAHDRVGFGHHHVQIMGNQQDTAAGTIPDFANELVDRDLSSEIDTLDWLVEYQKVRIAGQRTGEQCALEFAA